MNKAVSNIKLTQATLKRSVCGLTLAFSLMGLSSASRAAILLNDAQVLKLTASSAGITRLSVEGDKIQSVFTYPKEFEANLTLHESGHLFVLGEEGKGPVSVSLVTASGLVQDISLSFKKGASKPLILTSLDETASCPKEPPKSLEAEALEILSGFIKGNPSKGCVPGGFPEAESMRSFQTLTAYPLEIWNAPSFKVVIFQVKGEGGEVLDAAIFKQAGDLALAFDGKVLGASKTARLYVVKEWLQNSPRHLHQPLR